jgi:hypothetical protein
MQNVLNGAISRYRIFPSEVRNGVCRVIILKIRYGLTSTLMEK